MSYNIALRSLYAAAAVPSDPSTGCGSSMFFEHDEDTLREKMLSMCRIELQRPAIASEAAAAVAAGISINTIATVWGCGRQTVRNVLANPLGDFVRGWG